MPLTPFKITAVLLLLTNVCFSQTDTAAKVQPANKVYFEFKPVSGVLIDASSKDTSFYDLGDALGIQLKYALFYCNLTKDSLVVSLPYARQSFSRPVILEHQGIKFISKAYTYNLIPNKDGAATKLWFKQRILGLIITY